MPFSFLAPAFLAGFALLAVPVILHLVRQPRDQVVDFPSLMFLDAVEYRRSSRRSIRNWLLLVLRCLALAIVVAAFARPALDRPVAGTAALEGGRELVVLVDRSYSMAHSDRFDRARAAARDAIDDITREDRVTVVAFDDGASALNRPTSDRALLGAAIDGIAVGHGATHYSPALKLAESVLATSELPRREIVIISDFQASGWDEDAAVHLPAGTVVSPIAVAEGAAPANVVVTDVSFRRESFSGRDRIRATARIANQGAEPAGAVPVTLELDGRAVEERTATLAANDAATVEFEPFTLGRRHTRGTVRAGDDALPLDNRFHFALSPGSAVSVLILEPTGSSTTASLYLRRALEVGGEPGFQVDVRPLERFQLADLQGRDVVVLNGAAFPGGEAGRRLTEWVRRGGGLVFAAGERVGTRSWAPAGDALPGGIGRLVDRGDERPGALGGLSYGHPVFEAFRRPASGDFSGARVFRYRRLEDVDPDRVLARYDDGAVALAERAVEDGRVLLWTSSLDASWNDLPLRPVFLPFVHRLVLHASGRVEAPAWHTVGELLNLRAFAAPTGADADAAELPSGAEPVVLKPSGERVPLRGDARTLRLEEQGFYEIRDPAGSDAVAPVAAVNLDLVESELAMLDPARLVRAVAPPAGAAASAGGAAALLDPAERDRRQTLWWYLLAAGFVVLIGETALSNRLGHASR